MHRAIESFVALAVLTAGTLAAQQAGLEPGTRVRIHTAGAAIPLTGTVAYRDSGSVAVLRAPADTAFVPLTAITRVDVSTGRRSNVWRGTRLGGLIGAGAGAMLGMAAMADDGFIEFGLEAIPAGMIAGGLLGATVGLFIGAVSGSERWAPGSEAISVTRTGNRIAVSARLPF